MKKLLSNALKIFLSFAIVAPFSFSLSSIIWAENALAYSESNVHPTEGWNKCGTCEWKLDKATRTMTVRPLGNGTTGTLQSYSLPWNDDSMIIDVIVFEKDIKISGNSVSFMFDNRNLREIRGLGNLDTSSLTDLSYMFSGCQSLRYIDLKGFNTSSAMKMSSMFQDCSSLKSIDLSSFNTSYVNDMSSMFWECSSLQKLDLSNFKTDRVLDMSSMFWGCSRLGKVDISGFDTDSVKSKYSVFSGCSSISEITVGPNFTLQSELPEGNWSDSRGVVYDEFPVGVPGTFKYLGKVGKVIISPISKTVKLSSGNFSISASCNSSDWHGSIKWKSSNPLVASVNSKGVVTPQGIGVTTITATADRATANCVVTVVPDNVTIGKITNAKRSFTVKWKKPSSKNLSQLTGYQVRYSMKKSMKSSKMKTVKASSKNGKKCSLKVSKLKSKKKYYVQIRSYKKIGGNTYYSKWTKAKAVRVK